MVYIILGAVALQRLLELVLSVHNTRKLKVEGGIEIGAGHYPLFILLHGSWLLAIFLLTPNTASVNFWLLALYILLQFARVWIIASLGKYWTTRIITVPEAPLLKKGPYRYMRHPNYLIVICEIAVLPLVFGNWQIAVLWSLANALLITWRIHIENAALSMRPVAVQQL